MENLEEVGKKVKQTTANLRNISTKKKNEVLLEVAKAILDAKKEILLGNQKDIEIAVQNGIKDSLLDRLKIDENRLLDMTKALEKIADLKDPIGETIERKKLRKWSGNFEKKSTIRGNCYYLRIKTKCYGRCFWLVF